MRRLSAIALCMATVAFVPPKRDAPVEIAGAYDAVGTHPDGSTYAGRATIARLSADRYEITFNMPNGVFRALCLRVRDVLGCGWGSTKDLTVAIWRESASPGSSVGGVWTSDDTTLGLLGREECTGPSNSFSGKGLGPDALAYDAAIVATAYGAVQHVAWSRGSLKQLGWGIRVGSFLIAGFPAHRAGAAFYRIGPGGTSLVGDWMDPNSPLMAGLGTETLTR